VVLLRGVLLLIVAIGLVTSFEVLPAFSWLVQTTLPALLLAIPVIFAPEIRRALERLGRASAIFPAGNISRGVQNAIRIVVRASLRLSDRRHGALIVLQRLDGLQEYVETGVLLNAELSERLLLQIFYPNTPLHDGAVIISGETLVAAACVMPLAAGNIQALAPGRQMGLRHRAAIGISEVSDAVAVVVSEENGAISVAYGGRLTRRMNADQLETTLTSYFLPLQTRKGMEHWIARLFQRKEQV
jgi:diadenylate cyclase